ncbi:lectin protein kinase family protein [Euphorbia peplus]|nr:lectin protein kinase family protein [Euphorbia peplus]
MALLCHLNVILILRFFVILSVANFHQALNILNYSSSAKLPASWTNNEYLDQIILFSQNPNSSNDLGFGCGFYRDNNEGDSFYFAVGIVEASSKPVWSFNKTTWLANRNKPVGINATLQFKEDGNLELRDFDGSFVWSTNTSNIVDVVGMKMINTGNLVLYDKDGTTVWQSFDHPTDTLMIGQKLVEGQILVSSVSKSNKSEGNYYLSVTSKGLFSYYQADVLIELGYVTYAENISSETTFNISDLNLHFKGLPKPYAFFSSPTNNALISSITLDPDGHLRTYGDGYESYDYDISGDRLNECQYPTSCGGYGVCSGGSCSCLPGFVQSEVPNSLGKSGCSQLPIYATTCENASSSLISAIISETATYAAYGSKKMRTDMESCKTACLKNCSCTAVIFHQDSDNDNPDGDCIFPNPTLSLARSIGGGMSSILFRQSKDMVPRDGSDPIPREGGMSSLEKSSRKQITFTGLTIGILLLLILIVGVFWIIYCRKKRDANDGIEDDFDEVTGMPTRFTYEELKSATGDFQIKLGGGGFGSVYEGSMVLGEKIAVKRLDALGQGKKEFLAEVKSIGSIHYNNLVRLVGFCAEKMERLLVYEFMCNGSLDKWIFFTDPSRPFMDWETRKKIIVDVAKGLSYLHEDCRQRIVHLDIKPQNILLDADLNAKISDFGLAKLIERDQSQVVTTLRGTPGYMAPELFSSVVTEKADIYSFGIVFMEVVCGRRNLDRNQPEECMHLLPIFMKKAEEGQLIDMVDRNCDNMQFHRLEVAEMMKVAIWCLQCDYTRRPSMPMVVKVLEGTMEVETDLNYTVQNPTPMAAPATRRDGEVAVVTELFPSVLSAPR